MTGFHEVRFPDNIAYGATGGPEFATTVVATGSGHENAQRQLVRGARPLGCRERAQEAGTDRRADRILPGQERSRLRLPVQGLDRLQGNGELLGTGDDATTQFQLVKHYPSGSVIEVRTITKPIAGTVKVYLDGTLQARAGRSTRPQGSSPSARRRRSASTSPPTSSSTCRCGSISTTWR
jgi:Conserved hypothetical protein 2217 (DUF2460)